MASAASASTKRPPDALAARGLADSELIKEHLGALVPLRHLDAGAEAHRRAGRVVGDEQVVGRLRQEPPRGIDVGLVVEERAGGEHGVRCRHVRPDCPWREKQQELPAAGAFGPAAATPRRP